MCNGCSTLIVLGDGKYECRALNYDICMSCYSKRSNVQTTLSEQGTKTLDHSNKQVHLQMIAQVGNQTVQNSAVHSCPLNHAVSKGHGKYCHVCEDYFVPGNEKYECRACRFNICKSCYSGKCTAPLSEKDKQNLDAYLNNPETRAKLILFLTSPETNDLPEEEKLAYTAAVRILTSKKINTRTIVKVIDKLAIEK